MKLAEALKAITDILAVHEVKYPTDAKSKPEDALYREYVLTVNQLKAAVVALSNQNLNFEASRENLKPLLDVLEAHRKRVRFSPACNLVAPDSACNELSYLVSTKLSNAITTDKDFSLGIQFLLPDAKTYVITYIARDENPNNQNPNAVKTTQYRLANVGKFSGFVIAEDGAVIDFRASFLNARNGVAPVAFLGGNVGEVRAVTEQEIEYLKRHSNPVRAFLECADVDRQVRYDDLLQCLKTKYTVNDDMYGDKGLADLEARVLADWYAAKDVVTDHRYFLQGATLETLIARSKHDIRTDKLKVDKIYTGNQKQDRMALICLTEQYRRRLHDKSTETNTVLFGKISFTKSQKMIAVHLLMEFLQTDKSLDQLDSFVRAKGTEFEKYIGALHDEGWIWNSELCNIVILSQELHKKYASNDNEAIRAPAAATATAATQPAASTSATTSTVAPATAPAQAPTPAVQHPLQEVAPAAAAATTTPAKNDAVQGEEQRSPSPMRMGQ